MRGKICTSKAGAKFEFSRSGHYHYNGLWSSAGHYKIHNGFITVLLDSGLERDFAVASRDGQLYFEDTAVSCS
jgi:hypothetical protein